MPNPWSKEEQERINGIGASAMTVREQEHRESVHDDIDTNTGEAPQGSGMGAEAAKQQEDEMLADAHKAIPAESHASVYSDGLDPVEAQKQFNEKLKDGYFRSIAERQLPDTGDVDIDAFSRRAMRVAAAENGMELPPDEELMPPAAAPQEEGEPADPAAEEGDAISQEEAEQSVEVAKTSVDVIRDSAEQIMNIVKELGDSVEELSDAPTEENLEMAEEMEEGNLPGEDTAAEEPKPAVAAAKKDEPIADSSTPNAEGEDEDPLKDGTKGRADEGGKLVERKLTEKAGKVSAAESKGVILFADGARGIYIPQFFAQSIKKDLVKGVSDEDWEILEAGPDHDLYWETWNDVESSAEVALDGHKYTLTYGEGGGDLFLICPELMTPEEKEGFGMEPNDEPEMAPKAVKAIRVYASMHRRIDDADFAKVCAGLGVTVEAGKKVMAEEKTHELKIKSLDDAQLECSQGDWSYSKTGSMTRDEAKAEFQKHLDAIKKKKTNAANYGKKEPMGALYHKIKDFEKGYRYGEKLKKEGKTLPSAKEMFEQNTGIEDEDSFRNGAKDGFDGKPFRRDEQRRLEKKEAARTRKVGDVVVMSDDALDNYGEEYRDKPLTITHVSTKYMPAKDFFAKGKPEGYHPGYDESANGMALYDVDGFNGSLYEWEVKDGNKKKAALGEPRRPFAGKAKKTSKAEVAEAIKTFDAVMGGIPNTVKEKNIGDDLSSWIWHGDHGDMYLRLTDHLGNDNVYTIFSGPKSVIDRKTRYAKNNQYAIAPEKFERFIVNEVIGSPLLQDVGEDGYRKGEAYRDTNKPNPITEGSFEGDEFVPIDKTTASLRKDYLALTANKMPHAEAIRVVASLYKMDEKKAEMRVKADANAEESARKMVGDGGKPNKFWVSTSGDFLVNTKENQQEFNSALENKALGFVSTHKAETFGPFNTLEEAMEKANSLSYEIGTEPSEDGLNSVLVEDRQNGVIYENTLRGYAGKFGYRFEVDEMDDTSMVEDTGEEGLEAEGKKKAKRKKDDDEKETNAKAQRGGERKPPFKGTGAGTVPLWQKGDQKIFKSSDRSYDLEFGLHSDRATLHEDGTIVYDWPEAVPSEMKKAVKRLFKIKSECLAERRASAGLMDGKQVKWDIYYAGKKKGEMFFPPSFDGKKVVETLVQKYGYKPDITVKKAEDQTVRNQRSTTAEAVKTIRDFFVYVGDNGGSIKVAGKITARKNAEGKWMPVKVYAEDDIWIKNGKLGAGKRPADAKVLYVAGDLIPDINIDKFPIKDDVVRRNTIKGEAAKNMTRQEAINYLVAGGFLNEKVAAVYDTDPQVANAIRSVIGEGFEYPDYSHMTIRNLIKTGEKGTTARRSATARTEEEIRKDIRELRRRMFDEGANEEEIKAQLAEKKNELNAMLGGRILENSFEPKIEKVTPTMYRIGFNYKTEKSDTPRYVEAREYIVRRTNDGRWDDRYGYIGDMAGLRQKWVGIARDAFDAFAKEENAKMEKHLASSAAHKPTAGVGETILQQLGGNKFLAMTGAHVQSTLENMLAIKFPRAKDGINALAVYYDEGKDTYRMRFISQKGAPTMAVKDIAVIDDVYAEDLRRIFTEHTGLETSLGTMRGQKVRAENKAAFDELREIQNWFAKNPIKDMPPETYKKMADEIKAKSDRMRELMAELYEETPLRKATAGHRGKATGEADQEYDHAIFDKIVADLEAAGFPGATHKEFDKYQGVYINVPSVGKFWNTDYYVQVKTKADNAKYKKAELYGPDGDGPYSANFGDYWNMKPESVFEGSTLVLTKIDGETVEIDSPKKSDLPNDGEVRNTISYEGKPTDVFVFQSEKTGNKAEVDGDDTSEFIAMVKEESENGSGKTTAAKKPGGIDVRESKGKWEVVDRKDNDKVLGTHDTEEKAREQQKAIYASMNAKAENIDKKSRPPKEGDWLVVLSGKYGEILSAEQMTPDHRIRTDAMMGPYETEAEALKEIAGLKEAGVPEAMVAYAKKKEGGGAITAAANPIDIGDGYYVHKIGYDRNGNWAVWISKGANPTMKIQTNGEAPEAHRARGKYKDLSEAVAALSDRARDELKDYHKRFGTKAVVKKEGGEPRPPFPAR